MMKNTLLWNTRKTKPKSSASAERPKPKATGPKLINLLLLARLGKLP